MSKDEVIRYLIDKVKTLESQLKNLDSEISRLTEERGIIARAFDSYRYTLENESQENVQVFKGTAKAKMASHNFADLPIHRAAEIVLKGTAQGMTTRELTDRKSVV